MGRLIWRVKEPVIGQTDIWRVKSQLLHAKNMWKVKEPVTGGADIHGPHD